MHFSTQVCNTNIKLFSTHKSVTYTPTKQTFLAYTGLSVSFYLSILVSVCVQNANFCQSTGEGI